MPSFLLPGNVSRADIIAKVGRFLSLLSSEKTWEVEIKESRPRRTVDQNALLWALYTDILAKGGEQLAGWTKDDLHEFFLEHHFGSDVKELGGKTIEVPRRRSSKLSRQEFHDYVESILMFMAEQGVYIEMPRDAA